MLLKPRFDGCFDLVNITDCFLNFRPSGTVEQGNSRARPSGVACRGHLVERCVRDHPQYHRVFRADMCAEGTSQYDAVHFIDAEFVHQQTRPGIKRGLGHLDFADVAVGHGNTWTPAFGAIIYQI